MKTLTLITLLALSATCSYAGNFGNDLAAGLNGFAAGLQGRQYSPPQQDKTYTIMNPNGSQNEYRVQPRNDGKLNVTDERGRTWVIDEK